MTKTPNHIPFNSTKQSSASQKTGSSLSLPAVSVFQNKTESISQNNVLQPKWIKAGDGYLVWDNLIDGVRWYHHQTEDLMYFDTVDPNVDVKYGKLKGKDKAQPRSEWVKLRGGDDPMKDVDGGIKDLTQDGSVTTDGYRLTPANVGFSPEMIMLWNYFLAKGLQGNFVNRVIHIIKAPGTVGKVCHHWAFGGLDGGFNLDIDNIYTRLQNNEHDYLYSWDELDTPDALQELGSTSKCNIKVYNQSMHSSREINGLYYHKFSDFPFIFAIEGGDGNLTYGEVKSANIHVLNASGLGAASTFSYR